MGRGADRLVGLALALFSAAFYLLKWHEPEMYAVGLLLGLVLGAAARGLTRLVRLGKTTLVSSRERRS